MDRLYLASPEICIYIYKREWPQPKWMKRRWQLLSPTYWYQSHPNPIHTHNERTNLIFVPLESIHSEVPNVPRSAEEDLPTSVYRQAERRLEKIPCNQGIETFSEGERLRPIKGTCIPSNSSHGLGGECFSCIRSELLLSPLGGLSRIRTQGK